MLKVVSNTTPIISLLKLNKLDLLKQLYKQIHIPFAVYHEIEAGKTNPTSYTLYKIALKLNVELSQLFIFEVNEK